MFFPSFLLLIPIVSSHPQEFIAPVYELGGYIPPLPSGDVAPGKPSKLPQPIDFENRVGEGEKKPVVPPSFVLGSVVPTSSIPAWTPIQLIPPGKPWPSVDVDKTTKTPPNTGFLWPNLNNTESDRTTPVGDRFGGNEESSDKVTVLDYKPTRPSFHPNPGNNIQQIVPSGTPWPAKPIQTTEKPIGVNPSATPSPSFSLEYKPSRPSYHPNPGNNIQQIIPNGEPWPASFFINTRIDEDDEFPTDAIGAVYANDYQNYYSGYQPPVLVLDYKPNRPFYAGKPKE